MNDSNFHGNKHGKFDVLHMFYLKMLSIYCVTSTQGFEVDIGGLKWGSGAHYAK